MQRQSSIVHSNENLAGKIRTIKVDSCNQNTLFGKSENGSIVKSLDFSTFLKENFDGCKLVLR